MTGGRYALARAYNARRNAVASEYSKNGHSAKHKSELSLLEATARALHAAEDAEGVPRGSTRKELHDQGIARLTGENQMGEGCKVCV